MVSNVSLIYLNVYENFPFTKKLYTKCKYTFNYKYASFKSEMGKGSNKNMHTKIWKVEM